jgi:hypothetical protein
MFDAEHHRGDKEVHRITIIVPGDCLERSTRRTAGIVEEAVQPPEPVRCRIDCRLDTTQAALDRNPPRFAQLMHQYGAFPFREDDIDRARTAKGAERHSLFDCHPDWKHFFGF